MEAESKVIGLSIVELDLPADFLILLIKREKEYIKPTGSSILEENDMLLIQCNSENRYKKVLKRFKPQLESI
ncbi:MAG: TrkA C-terminal domain-containing protein [Aliarcobacter sp.]|nr:TrkA C-terminal domain-containing protein [Aliarcobacter sp.]